MAPLEITITKGAAADIVESVSATGNVQRFSFPKKGPIPHDGVHAIVEDALGFRRAFWGLIAEGVAPEAIQAMAKAGGHASASRAETPDSAIVELIQAERVVECFEAEFWGEPASLDTFRSVVDAACAASFVAPVALGDDVIINIRNRIRRFADEWAAAPLRGAVRLRFPTTG